MNSLPATVPSACRRRPRKRRGMDGFTLMELLITLAIAGILISLAVPAFDELIRGNRLTTDANNFVTAVHTARAEAARLRGPVSLRPMDGAGGWDSGAGLEVRSEARAFQDLNRDGDFLDANESVLPATLKRFPAFAGATQVGPEDVATLITFLPNGLVQTGTLLLELCTDGSPNCRRVTVTTSGRVSVAEFVRSGEVEEDE